MSDFPKVTPNGDGIRVQYADSCWTNVIPRRNFRALRDVLDREIAAEDAKRWRATYCGGKGISFGYESWQVQRINPDGYSNTAAIFYVRLYPGDGAQVAAEAEAARLNAAEGLS